MSEDSRVLTIQVIGPGCPRRDTLERRVYDACAELGSVADIVLVRDLKEYAKLGIVFTPALVVDGKVVLSGRVPSLAELKGLLGKLAGAEV
ncbi:MAG: thioredoxin family protein [bacterium]|jgi:small redox-active disulfide protein 2|nr:thioredoxin family protein [candidate division KSB1 bacterium]MDH7560966.1 thioredoxin family protein [bacterium]